MTPEDLYYRNLARACNGSSRAIRKRLGLPRGATPAQVQEAVRLAVSPPKPEPTPAPPKEKKSWFSFGDDNEE